MQLPFDIGEIRRRLIDCGELDRYSRFSANKVSSSPPGQAYSLTSGEGAWILRCSSSSDDSLGTRGIRAEATALHMLEKSSIPVPLLVYRDEVSGLVVSRRVHGSSLRTDIQLADVEIGARSLVANSFADTLAGIHSLEVGLDGVSTLPGMCGELHNYLSEIGIRLARHELSVRPALNALLDSLARSVPEPRKPCLLHGGYRLDRTVFDLDDSPLLRAVTDWRRVGFGDPLLDVGIAYVFWAGLRGIPSVVSGCPSVHFGYPAFEQVLSRYRRSVTFHVDTRVLPWFYSVGFLEVAARVLELCDERSEWLSSTNRFGDVSALVTPLITRAVAALEGSHLAASFALTRMAETRRILGGKS